MYEKCINLDTFIEDNSIVGKNTLYSQYKGQGQSEQICGEDPTIVMTSSDQGRLLFNKYEDWPEPPVEEEIDSGLFANTTYQGEDGEK